VDVRLTGALGQSQRAGRITADLLLGWLRQAAAGPKPVFAFLHLYEPHSPYTPPEPFASRYRSSPYDGEIATADAIVGDFLGELRKLDLYDRAIVVLLSDHGEGLGDHGEREHGLLLYREALQVPLLLKLPGSRQHGRRVQAPAQLVDVYPTLLGLAGLPVPPKLPGRSLLDLDRPGQPAREIYSETMYPRLHFGWSELASLIRDRFHYLHGPDPELYDLAADRGERRNVLAAERPVFFALRRSIQTYQRDLAAPAAADQETRQRLASLGYAVAATAVGAGQRLPDPKRQIPTLEELSRATELYAAQRYAEAVPAFRSALAHNPRMVDGWERLGESLVKLGQLSDALAAYQQAIKLSGGAAQDDVAAGFILLQMGRYDEARAHAELARRQDSGLAQSLVGAIALAEQRPREAEAVARAAAGDAATNAGGGGLKIGPLVTLAEARAKQGKLEEALATLDQADQVLARRAPGQSYPGLAFVRGDVLARMGRNREAEQAFLREIRSNPAEVRAFASLAMLYAAEDRSQEAFATLQKLVDANRSPAAYGMAVRTLRVLGDPDDATTLLGDGLRRFPQSPELAALTHGR
jgi:tetratricopeptide (TPR) repeat protein